MRVRIRAAGIALGLTVLVGAIVGWGALVEPYRLVETHIEHLPPRWPSDMAPVRIVFMADFHVGSPGMDVARLRTIVDRVNAWQPDLILLGGDFVAQGVLGGRLVPPEETAGALAALRARHGVFSVLGNHDWWLDGWRVRRALEANGIIVLENEAHRAGPLWIVGLADDTTRMVEPDQALREVPPGVPFVVLMHDPANLPDLRRFASLVLAGHTHAGQVRLPWVGPLIVPGRAPRSHSYGLIEEAGQAMFVTAGLGTSILPVRVGAPPEVVLVTLGGKQHERRFVDLEHPPLWYGTEPEIMPGHDIPS